MGSVPFLHSSLNLKGIGAGTFLGHLKDVMLCRDCCLADSDYKTLLIVRSGLISERFKYEKYAS